MHYVREIRRIYGKRSGVSHGGRAAVEESELRDLTGIAANVVRALSARRGQFRTRDDLHSWIDEQKMS